MASTVSRPVETFHRAVEELAEARTRSDRLKGREAAEKAWLAVVEATDRYLARKGIVIPEDRTAHSQRRRALYTLGRDGLRRTYSDLAISLHGDVFYFDDPGVSPKELDALFADAARYVEEMTGKHGLLKEVLDMGRGGGYRAG
jgi:hypothetical protein